MSGWGETAEATQVRVPGPRRRHGVIEEFYLRTVDAWIPESIQTGEAELLRRSRIVVSFTLALVILGVEAIVFFHWTLPAEASRQLELSLAAALFLTWLVPSALRHFNSLALAANLVIAGSFLVVFTTILLLGGITAPIIHWCALMPMLAVLMGTRRSAWFWGGISTVTVAGFAWANTAGLEFTDHLAASGLAGSRILMQRIVDVSSWIGILMAVAFLYERHKDEQATELGATNAELKREIGQRKRAEERTRYLAYYDELTTLPNRQFFKQQLRRAMYQAERAERMVGVLFLDLDGFKEVNDTYGHDLGDLLLRNVAERLTRSVRQADSVARGVGDDSDQVVSRLGGDEFTVLLVDIRSADEAEMVAKRILGELERPARIEERDLYITVSIGIAMYPCNVENVDGLLKNADLAMYHAKATGRNTFEIFDESMLTRVANRTALANDIRKALERREFVLHYQPIFDAPTRSIVALEALIRWQHPVKGLLAPYEFIHVAETTGQIIPIGGWVVREACLRLGEWHQAGHASLRIAVNVSAAQLKSDRFCEDIAATLEECGLDPQSLEIEVTENAMMVDEREVSLSLLAVKELGVRIALDDFGTGYSSLSYARRFPVHALKIDRSFVAEISERPEAEAITTAIIALAHGLRLKVVGEGVETEAQERFLDDHGCDELQGFLFSHPVPADEVLAVLDRAKVQS
jgi:diguanylate cyclase (GGDEF)-like protein